MSLNPAMFDKSLTIFIIIQCQTTLIVPNKRQEI